MGSNCVLRDTVNLQVLSNPPLDLGGDVVICSDTILNVQLGGNPTGPASSTYIWGPAGKLNNSNSPNPTTTDALSRTYTLLVIDTSGCKNVDSVRVRKFSFTVSSGEVKCGGDSLQLSVNDLFGTPPFQYKWRPNTFLSTDTIANPIAVPDSSISYSLVITDSNNCTDSTFVPVNVRLTAQADFNLKIRSGCEMAKISTDNLGDPAHQYIWYHNDVAISSGFNAELETDFSTQHNIRLWVMTADSCVDTSTQIANVLSAEALFGDTLPNVFTPNNDGINDKIDFTLGNDLRECATVFVYNRWGELVFESTHGYPIWDGTTFSGEPCKVGVYFYKLDLNGEAFTGYVTLLR
jgi:gliding motility-associated-like protein